MQLGKRTFLIFSLGSVTALVITAFLAGYYYMEFQKEAQLRREYANVYNALMQNYTNLLNEYLELAQRYESEKQNLTELLEKYGSCIMRVNVCIDYKEWNGTVVWYNDTIVPLGCNLLNVTKMVATVDSTYWSAYQASFVDSINGVANNSLYYWMWLYWDENENMWKYGPVGADCYILEPNERIMWRYEIPGW